MQFLVLAGTTGGVNVMNINQQRSTFSPNSTYAEPFIVNTNAATGVKSCTHFQPYVDVATGELRAEVSHRHIIQLVQQTSNDLPGCGNLSQLG